MRTSTTRNGLLDAGISRRVRLVTDAEVLQEILHRYHAVQRYDAIQPALDVLLAVVDEVVPVERDTVLRPVRSCSRGTVYRPVTPSMPRPWRLSAPSRS